ncbi:DUF1330 domain-containing protein [Actinomycetospora cinnamomea]|uniref:Uncharacterized protein DUF1330 n=1 Tax=Actinomycetospora cinnamomea TaxID=663609 RepID=A0A2U1FIW1_9PSEU|nr:DUF1330 domain-containing protein [Actinomycetospora cinnamomea]PVZ12102.1 uncharacterized protein DUF1330 [Actinomycetospora cinnamomea]
MAVDPRGRDLKTFLAEDPGGPVVMLNLLRFRPDTEGGHTAARDSYTAYLAHFRRYAEPRGAEILYLGEGSTALVAEDGQAWDAVLIVRYPSRQAFSDMVADPGYQQGTHLRSDALTEAVLQATTPWIPPEAASGAPTA